MLENKDKEMLTKKVISAIGLDNLKQCSKAQLDWMDQMLDEDLEERSAQEVTEPQIIGIYEMVMEHLLPIDFNAELKKIKKKEIIDGCKRSQEKSS